MIRATRKDKKAVVAILCDSFLNNKSVLSITNGKQKRIKSLVQYAFDNCIDYGFIYISEDKHACALAILPDKKTTNVKSICRDLLFCFNGLGFLNVSKALKREKLIKEKQLHQHVYHLWFIGVLPKFQHSGKGSTLLKFVLKDAELKNRKLILETSTSENVDWYSKFGLKVYDRLDLGYDLNFLSA